MRISWIAGAAAAVLLAACGSQESGTIETEDGEATYAIDASGGNSQYTARNADGETVTVNTGNDVAVDLPEGFSVYPGATVVSNSNVATSDGKGSVLFMTTQDSPEKVAGFYRRQAEAAGIEIAMEMASGDSQLISGESADGKTMTMNASTNDEGTTVQLMAGDKLGD